jgi:predicted metal-dependent HD superfamily phosphohydrolase
MPLEYKEYASNIRKEYIHYPGCSPFLWILELADDAFRKGRIQVLQKLKEGNLFRTEDFVQRYEQAAKQNLENEIASLSSE